MSQQERGRVGKSFPYRLEHRGKVHRDDVLVAVFTVRPGPRAAVALTCELADRRVESAFDEGLRERLVVPGGDPEPGTVTTTARDESSRFSWWCSGPGNKRTDVVVPSGSWIATVSTNSE